MTKSVNHLTAESLVVGSPIAERPRRRRRQLSVAAVKRQADKAGLTLAAVTYAPDGSTTAQFGDPSKQINKDDQVNPLDAWMAKHAN